LAGRLGQNQRFAAAGGIAVTLKMAVIAYSKLPWTMFVPVVLALPVLVALRFGPKRLISSVLPAVQGYFDEMLLWADGTIVVGVASAPSPTQLPVFPRRDLLRAPSLEPTIEETPQMAAQCTEGVVIKDTSRYETLKI
jgi:hypothetical protein